MWNEGSISPTSCYYYYYPISSKEKAFSKHVCSKQGGLRGSCPYSTKTLNERNQVHRTGNEKTEDSDDKILQKGLCLYWFCVEYLGPLYENPNYSICLRPGVITITSIHFQLDTFFNFPTLKEISHISFYLFLFYL